MALLPVASVPCITRFWHGAARGYQEVSKWKSKGQGQYFGHYMQESCYSPYLGVTAGESLREGGE